MATIIDRHSQPTWYGFLELTKSEVVALMSTISLIGMLFTTKVPLDGFVLWQVLTLGNPGTDLCAGVVAAVSRVVGRRIDSIMARTHEWSLAEDRVSPSMALDFALLLALAGMAVLLAFTNPLMAWLTLTSPLGYAALYTGFLKRVTPQDIVISGLAGATPPLLGWVAIIGHLSTEPPLLVLVIFARTLPHFRTLCIHRKDECARTDIPMLSVIHGERYIGLRILFYALVPFAVSLILFVIHMSGLVYLPCVLVLDARFFDQAWALYCDSRLHAAIKIFKHSTIYLFLLPMALLVDHHLPLKLLLWSRSRTLSTHDSSRQDRPRPRRPSCPGPRPHRV